MTSVGRRRLPIVFSGIAIGLALGAAVALVTPESYLAQADVQITVTEPRDAAQDVEAAARAARVLALSYGVVADSSAGSVVGPAGCQTGEDSVPVVDSFALQGTSVIRISVRSNTARCASEHAAAAAAALISDVETTENVDTQAVRAAVVEGSTGQPRDLRPPAVFHLLAGMLVGATGGLAVSFYRDDHLGRTSRT